MKDTYAEIELQFSTMIEYLAALENTDTVEKLGSLHEEMLIALNVQMDRLYDKVSGGKHIVDRIDADRTLLYVKGSDGRYHSRNLPMDYHENDNGITIAGENMRGEATEIAFISQAALTKMKELTGHGPSEPRCDHD